MRVFRLWNVVALMGVLLLGGCSGQPQEDREEIPVSSAGDPPGAAQALSLGGGGLLEGKTDFENSVNCAVALKTTITAVAALRGDDSEEIRALKAVQQIYRRRAGAAAVAGGGSEASATIEIEKGSLAGSEAGQAQLAIACVNALQEEVD